MQPLVLLHNMQQASRTPGASLTYGEGLSRGESDGSMLEKHLLCPIFFVTCRVSEGTLSSGTFLGALGCVEGLV